MFRLLVSITCLAVLATIGVLAFDRLREYGEKVRLDRLLARAESGHCDTDLSSEDLATCLRFQAARGPNYTPQEKESLDRLIQGSKNMESNP